MTAEIKTFPDPADLAAYVQALYTGGSTAVRVVVLKPSVYLIQDET